MLNIIKFLEYIPTVDVTGSGLANLIITALKKHGLECSHMVGQGYDGAAVISGYLHGVQAYIRQECALALYVQGDWLNFDHPFNYLNFYFSKEC